jgi:hypothetical protein
MITTPVGMAVVGFGCWGPNVVRNIVERPEPSGRPVCIWGASAQVAPATAGVGAGPPCPAAERAARTAPAWRVAGRAPLRRRKRGTPSAPLSGHRRTRRGNPPASIEVAEV